MKMKKMLTVLLSAVMLLTVATGCQKKQVTTQSESTTPAAIKIVVIYRPQMDDMAKQSIDLNNNKISQAHEKNSGIKVTWESLPKTDADTKIAMIFASGDVPDLIQMDRNSTFKYAVQGAIMPLDSLISKYGSDYTKSMANVKETLETCKYNGKAIAFVTRAEDYPKLANQGLIVRRDIMDELGLKDPTTLDEFVTLLKTVKEKKNMIPFECSSATGIVLPALEGAFGVSTTTVVKNGQLQYSATASGFKDYLTFMKGLYDQGLLDKEFSVIQDIKQKVVAGQAFCFPGVWVDISLNKTQIAQKVSGAKLDFIPYPEGTGSLKGAAQQNPFGEMSSIPAKAKNSATAAKYINYMCSDKANMIQDYGIENDDYKMDNGKSSQTLAQQLKVGWKIIYMLVQGPDSFMNRLKLKGYDPEWNRAAEVSKNCINKETTAVMPPSDTVDKATTTINDLTKQFATKVVMGVQPISSFDDYVKQFNAAGGKDAIDAMNTWYKTQTKK
jgi:putative aldouronate transport system substrate-binding protein